MSKHLILQGVTVLTEADNEDEARSIAVGYCEREAGRVVRVAKIIATVSSKASVDIKSETA